MGIRLVCFDMSGTTVNDLIDGIPLVLRSYSEAFEFHGIQVSMETLNDVRGRDKREVVYELGGDKSSVIYIDLLKILQNNTSKVKEIEGTSNVFKELQIRGIKIALGTGYPAIVSKSIVDHIGWKKKGLIDYWTCSEIVGENRPSPIMITRAMRALHIRDPREVVKVDDTAIGIMEGKNAGTYTVAVLTGTQIREKLENVKPDAILSSIRELPKHLEEKRLL